MSILDSASMRKHSQSRAPADLSDQAVKLARRVQSLPAGAYTITMHITSDDMQWSVHKVGKIERA